MDFSLNFNNSMRVLKLYCIYTSKYNNIKYNEAYQFVFWSRRS